MQSNKNEIDYDKDHILKLTDIKSGVPQILPDGEVLQGRSEMYIYVKLVKIDAKPKPNVLYYLSDNDNYSTKYGGFIKSQYDKLIEYIEAMYSYTKIIYKRREIVECCCKHFILSLMKRNHWWEYLPNPGFPIVYSNSTKNTIRVLGDHGFVYDGDGSSISRKFADISKDNDGSNSPHSRDRYFISINGGVNGGCYTESIDTFHILYRIAKHIGTNPNVWHSSDAPLTESFTHDEFIRADQISSKLFRDNLLSPKPFIGDNLLIK